MMTSALQTFGQSINEIAFWIGAGSVLLFAHNRFKIQSVPPDTLDPPVHARALTTRLRYGIAQFTYMSIYWAIFVMLVCFGSFQEFQDLLEKVVGSIPWDDQSTVASPAWAALVATTVLPSVPGFNSIDQRIRTFLHDISSIPTKAHRLARDILKAARAETTELSGQPLPGLTYLKLRELIDQLANKERTPTARMFCSFRREQQEFLDDIQKKFTPGERDLPPQVEEVYLKELLVKLSRFLSCALLSSQPDELTARRHLKKLGLDLPEAGWQFRIEQIAVSVVTVAALTLVGGYAANLLMLGVGHAMNNQDLAHIEWGAVFIGELISWVLYAVPMFTLPLIFAAGVKLYLVDRQRYAAELDGEDAKIPWEDLYLASAVAFIGAYFLACFPVLLGFGARIDGATDMGAISTMVKMAIAWGLPPAIFAVIFMHRSSAQPGKLWPGRFADFFIHGLPVGLASTLLAFIFINPTLVIIDPPVINQAPALGVVPYHEAIPGFDTAAYLNPAREVNLFKSTLSPLQMRIMIGVVSWFVAGCLGAINCSISRRSLNPTARKAAKQDQKVALNQAAAKGTASAQRHQDPFYLAGSGI